MFAHIPLPLQSLHGGKMILSLELTFKGVSRGISLPPKPRPTKPLARELSVNVQRSHQNGYECRILANVEHSKEYKE